MFKNFTAYSMLFLAITIVPEVIPFEAWAEEKKSGGGWFGNILDGAGEVIGEHADTIGGTVGGMIGAKLGDATGAGLGAAFGSWLGSSVLSSLSKADQAQINQASASAIENGTIGQTTTWKNSTNGSTATITPKSSQQQKQDVTVIRPKTIAQPVNMTVIGARHIASATVNLRAGPQSVAEKIGKLEKGQEVTAIGSVSNGRWLVVGEKSVIKGYVWASYLEPIEKYEAKQAELRQKQTKEESFASAKNDGALNLDDDEFVIEEVTASAECRDTEMTVTDGKSGERETSNFTACKGADGAWEIN